jgi:DNA-binding NarL/FixJ family response regulator
MNVIIADHNTKARKALADLLREQPEIYVIDEATDTNSLLALVTKQVVDVIMLESGLPRLPLTDLIPEIREIKRMVKVIVMSSDPENARFALNSGADFFVSKTNQPEWLLETLHRCEKMV